MAVHIPRLAVTAVLALAAASTSQAAAEVRCGWFQNPTPANYWLDDRDGEWIVSVQGGYQAEGPDLPDMAKGGWVVTNGPDYGYGCGCLTAVFDHKRKQVTRIISARSLPLGQCRADHRLPKP